MIVVSDTSPINYLVLIDERIGRQAAEDHGVPVYGTLGIILVAAERKLVNPEDALGRLQQTNFRVSPRLLRSVRERKPID